MSAPHPRRRLRVLVLAAGGFSLVMGLWTGLARAGVHAPIGPVGAHGVLMVLGFLGTLIALERAVALRARWAFGAPILSAASMVALVAGVPTVVAGSGLTVAGGLLTAAYVVLLHRRVTLDLVLMGTGAVAWIVAATLWAAGWSPVRLAPTLAAFLVFTSVGERLELSRLRQPSPGARRRLVLAAGVFGLGAAVTLVDFRVGLVVAGLGLAAQASWLLRHDVARVTIRRPGLPRFAAACLLSGHAWLAIGGVLWMAWDWGSAAG